MILLGLNTPVAHCSRVTSCIAPAPALHLLCAVTDTHCVAGHGDRETQGPEPVFASIGSPAQVESNAAQESKMGQAERKEAIQQFLLLLYLSTPAETPTLYSRQDFLFIYLLTTSKLPLTTDLSAWDDMC